MTNGQTTLEDAVAANFAGLCDTCHQRDIGQTGEYPCTKCGLPTLHDPPAGWVSLHGRLVARAMKPTPKRRRSRR
jgi:hypothetical protein